MNRITQNDFGYSLWLFLGNQPIGPGPPVSPWDGLHLNSACHGTGSFFLPTKTFHMSQGIQVAGFLRQVLQRVHT